MMIDKDIPSTFRSSTRQSLLCIYPLQIMSLRKELKSNKSLTKENKLQIKKDILDSIEYETIQTYSPKYDNVINIINISHGPVLLYSNYYNIEGLLSLSKYLILSGYTELNLKEINMVNLEAIIVEFRKKKEELVGKPVVFNLTSDNSEEYLNYCNQNYNISSKEDFAAKIQELTNNLAVKQSEQAERQAMTVGNEDEMAEVATLEKDADVIAAIQSEIDF